MKRGRRLHQTRALRIARRGEPREYIRLKLGLAKHSRAYEFVFLAIMKDIEEYERRRFAEVVKKFPDLAAKLSPVSILEQVGRPLLTS